MWQNGNLAFKRVRRASRVLCFGRRNAAKLATVARGFTSRGCQEGGSSHATDQSPLLAIALVACSFVAMVVDMLG